MWNEPFAGISLLRQIEERLRASLPAGWSLSATTERGSRRQPDAVLELSAPSGPRASIAIATKQRIEPRDVPNVLEQLRVTGARNLLAAAPFLGPQARKMLAERGAGYADSTGNLRLVLDEPAVFIERAGANSSPWRENRPLHSLKGPAAARVVRALCDFRPPYTVGDLAVRAATSASSVSRILDLLDRDALVTRGPRGAVEDVRWNELIHRWIRDYSMMESNRARSFLEPRGMMIVNNRLLKATWRYCVTGEQAAVFRVPLTVVRLGVIYVESIEAAAERLELRPVDTGANVLLIEPFDPVVFERPQYLSPGAEIAYCRESQVAADMLTSPGRAPAEGEELLRWMSENEDEWRS